MFALGSSTSMRPIRMKLHKLQTKQLKKALLVTSLLISNIGYTIAGVTHEQPAMSTPESPPLMTGTLSLLMDSHFVSYGQDVWGAGQSWEDPLFHPSLALNFNLTSNFTFFVGSWLDVNDNLESNSTLGNRVQEIDVWAGVSYALDKFKFTLINQYWNYGGNTEKIIDFRIDYKAPLNPYLLIHGRFDRGAAESFGEGVVVQTGISPTTELGPLSLSLPIALSYDTHDYHGGQAGFGFATVVIGDTKPL
ncbi:MAG: hypothetical protein OJI67_09905, partial [Prosthecobacter sp.]|nr:hypothetical protein [Prosthecobacter sp.]